MLNWVSRGVITLLRKAKHGVRGKHLDDYTPIILLNTDFGQDPDRVLAVRC